MLRIGLYLLTNFLVLLVAGFALSVAGSMGLLGDGGASAYLPSLLIAAVFGFGGSFVSLAISKWMAKRSTGARVINEPQNDTERWLVDTVARQAQAAGIDMPEVAIYGAPDMNAFATGMRKNAALVAVSEGLLRGMDKDAVEAVLAHEISHVANGDMVTLSLIQGVVNTFVIFFARVLAGIISSALSRRGRGVYSLVYIVLQMAFGFLASLVVMAFSRWREFRADHGASGLESPEKMISALEALKGSHAPALPSGMQSFGILGAGGIGVLLRSHPPLDARIARLKMQARFG